MSPRTPVLYSLISVLGGLCLAARAGTIETPQAISDAAAAYVAAQSSGDSRASAAPLDPRLHLAACDQDLQTSAQAPNSRGFWSVSVHCPSPQAWTIYVPVRLAEHKTVVVLQRPLSPGMPIPADALKLESRDTSTLQYGYLEHIEDVSGKILRHPVAVGAPMPPAAVAAPTSIRRGQQLTLVSRAGGFEVRAGGKALADAAQGERVRAENLDSHRIVEGVVLDVDTVEISAE